MVKVAIPERPAGRPQRSSGALIDINEKPAARFPSKFITLRSARHPRFSGASGKDYRHRKVVSPCSILGYPKFTMKLIKDIPRRGRGRPSTGGRRDGVLVRFEPDQFEALDAWVARQGRPLSRPEAIRRLVELGLKAKAK
jgi:hypothetical protein